MLNDVGNFTPFSYQRKTASLKDTVVDLFVHAADVTYSQVVNHKITLQFMYGLERFHCEYTFDVAGIGEPAPCIGTCGIGLLSTKRPSLIISTWRI